jgi:hypothetical protein
MTHETQLGSRTGYVSRSVRNVFWAISLIADASAGVLMLQNSGAGMGVSLLVGALAFLGALCLLLLFGRVVEYFRYHEWRERRNFLHKWRAVHHLCLLGGLGIYFGAGTAVSAWQGEVRMTSAIPIAIIVGLLYAHFGVEKLRLTRDRKQHAQ